MLEKIRERMVAATAAEQFKKYTGKVGDIGSQLINRAQLLATL